MNNTICKFAPLLGATELSLTIALVVFVMLTVMLGAIILLLCISKNFRVFFFRETHDAAHDATDEPAATADAAPTEKPADEPAENPPAPVKKQTTRRKKTTDIFDGIPTVPLTFIASEQETKKSRRKTSQTVTGDVRSVIAENSDKPTYTPRTVSRDKTATKPTDDNGSPRRRARKK